MLHREHGGMFAGSDDDRRAHTATGSLSWRSSAHTKGELADAPRPQLYKPADVFKWPNRIAWRPAEVSLIAV
jgi:hypothetical protein